MPPLSSPCCLYNCPRKSSPQIKVIISVTCWLNPEIQKVYAAKYINNNINNARFNESFKLDATRSIGAANIALTCINEAQNNVNAAFLYRE